MARPRLRPCFLAVGAGLAAAYASVSDFTGVIQSYYSDNWDAGAPTPAPTPVCDFAGVGARPAAEVTDALAGRPPAAAVLGDLPADSRPRTVAHGELLFRLGSPVSPLSTLD